jgi:hypothetical protein
MEEGASVATPAQVDVWVGLDVGKGEYFADVLDDGGERRFAWAVAHDQADLELLLEHAAQTHQPARPAPGLPKAA